jgi:hypothetical protein
LISTGIARRLPSVLHKPSFAQGTIMQFEMLATDMPSLPPPERCLKAAP